jgi:hypothetical protein
VSCFLCGHDSVCAVCSFTNMTVGLRGADKWGDYQACATGPVKPTLFIPMKTPLSQVSAWCTVNAQAAAASMQACHITLPSQAILGSWQQDQPPAHPWTISHLLATQQSAGRKVGLIMDLSNHDTLYAADIPPSLEYKHIQLVAKVSAAVVRAPARCKHMTAGVHLSTFRV